MINHEQNMSKEKEYFAFISYKSEDVEWATWLQHELEHYHLPASFNGRTDVPKELRPVFRDIDELSAGNLPEQIKQALFDSQNLIVICSPQAAESSWVNQEVETFIALGRTDCIFPFIVEGNSPSEFFPPALRELPKDKERLGGDVSKNGRDAAFVKVVAGMLRVGFDSLWNRYEKEKAEEERILREQRDNLLRVQSYYLAEKANSLEDCGESYKAIILSLESLPLDFEKPNRPYVAESEASLRKAVTHYISNDSLCYKYKSLITFEGSQCKIAFGPDGKYLASVTKEAALKIWEVGTGRLLKVKNNICINHVEDVRFSYDGNYIAVIGCGDFSLYNTKDFSCATGWIENDYKTMAFHPHENKILISRFKDSSHYGRVNSINVCDYEGRYYLTIQTQTQTLVSASFNKQGNLIVSANKEGEINIWDANTGILVNTLKNNIPIITAFFTADSRMIVSVDESNIKFWDFENNSIQYSLGLEPKTSFTSATLSQNGELIIASLSNNKINIWTANRDIKLLGSIKSPFETISSVVISPSYKNIATSSKENIIRLWEVKKKGNEFKQKKEANWNGHPLAYFIDCNTIITTSSKCDICIWNNHQLVKEIHTDHYSNIFAIAYNTEDNFIISADEDCIKKWDIETGQMTYSIELGHDFDIKKSAIFSYDGTRIMAIYNYHEFRIWNTGAFPKPTILQTNNKYCGNWGGVEHASLSPDNRFFVVGYSSGRIDIRDAETGEILKALQEGDSLNERGDICSVYFSHNGNFVVWATEYGTIKIGDAKSGKIIHILEHGEPFDQWNSSVLFFPNDKWIVSSSKQFLKIWDTESGVLIYSISCSTGKLFPNSISPDCSKIAFSNPDGQVEIIEVDTCQKLSDALRDHFKDYSLTKDERKKYYLI